MNVRGPALRFLVIQNHPNCLRETQSDFWPPLGLVGAATVFLSGFLGGVVALGAGSLLCTQVSATMMKISYIPERSNRSH